MPIQLRISDNDPYVYIQPVSSGSVAIGTDAADSNKLKIVSSSAIADLDPSSGTPSISIDPNTPGNITFQPKGTGESIFNTGDVALLSGNLDLTVTAIAGTSGVINAGGTRFVSNYGTDNSFIGTSSGNFSLTTASATDNTGIGFNALHALTTGPFNTCVGSGAGQSINTGFQNTSVGNTALSNVTSGTDNVAVGFTTGANITGSFNTLLGSGTSPAHNAITNSIYVGPYVTGGALDDRVIRIGNQSGAQRQTSCFIAGIAGGSNTPTGVVGVDANGLLAGSNGTNGQVHIGGGTGPVWANITSSGGTVTITNGANTINLEATVPGDTWNDVTSTPVTMAPKNGYVVDNGAALVTLNLPAVAAFGSRIEIVGKSSGGWTIAQGVGQTIHFGHLNTTTGGGGSLSSTLQYDCVELICVTANTDFVVKSSIGNLTVV